MSKPASKPPSGKRWLWLAVAVVVVAAVGVVVAIVLGNRNSGPAYEPEVTGAPRAAVAEPVVDHGAVAFEQPVQSVYAITNVGDQPLEIRGEPRVELVAGC